LWDISGRRCGWEWAVVRERNKRGRRVAPSKGFLGGEEKRKKKEERASMDPFLLLFIEQTSSTHA
jgi:hypothetical protein